MSQDRLGIGIIGAGKVGTVLATALAGAGHSIIGASTVDALNLERVEAMLPGVPILPEQEVIRRAELVIFAVPGKELPELVAGLTKLGVWQTGQLVLHTAPEHGYSVFLPALAQGVIPLAIHPALSFTGTSVDLSRLRGARAVVSAPKAVLPIAQALAVEMGAEPVVLPDAERPAYAAALQKATATVRQAAAQAHASLAALGVASPRALLGELLQAELDNTLRKLGDSEEHDGEAAAFNSENPPAAAGA